MDQRSRNQPAEAAPPARGGGLLYATVATTGASVMTVEVLGTRVIAPFYGVGLFVWTALISVTMVALAVGYRVGGRLGDRRGRGGLSLIIGAAAVLVALIPALRPLVLTLTDPLGLRLGSLTAALLLFGAPLTLLGMVGPYVIRLRAERIDTVGSTAGTVFAVSTAGSVIGTLLVGFLLLPAFGTQAILIGTSVVLFLLTALVWWYERDGKSGRPTVPAATGAVLLLALLGGARDSRGTEDGRFTTLHDAESFYGRVRVMDDRQMGLRWMLVDASSIGAVYTGTHEAPFPYLYVLETLGELRPEAKRALVIGLGAGYLPGALARQGMTVDTIEIDPEVVRAAERHFGFVAPGAMIVGDARYEVRRLRERYDLIVHDCFTGGEMPWHLFSAEMLRTTKERLNEGGLLAMNFFGLREAGRAEAMSAVAATLDAEFPHRLTLAPAPGEDLFDRIFITSTKPIDLPAGPARRPLSELAQRAYASLPGLVTSLPGSPEHVVTDDHNPLEALQLRKGEAYHRLVRERFGADFLKR